MAQTIKIKRGNNADLDSVTLELGEPAFVLDTGKLYIGDGTDKILINPDGGISDTANKLTIPRTISLSGDVTGSVSFDGSSNVDIVVTEKSSGVIVGTYTKVTVDEKGNVTSATNLVDSDIPNLTLSKISDAGTSASKNVGTLVGEIPVIGSDGKIDSNLIGSIAITDTFEVSSEIEMLALICEKGDIAVRSDINKTFILKTSDATILSNWVELKTPTSAVISVNGRNGVIVLSASDVGLENVTNESKETMFTSPNFTGVPNAPTADVSNNTTQIATTAYVKSQGYLSSSDIIDGGTF